MSLQFAMQDNLLMKSYNIAAQSSMMPTGRGEKRLIQLKLRTDRDGKPK